MSFNFANIHGANLDGITWEHFPLGSTWEHDLVYCLHFHVLMWLGHFVHVVSNIVQLIDMSFTKIHGANLDGITWEHLRAHFPLENTWEHDLVWCLHSHVFMWLGCFIHVVSNIVQFIDMSFNFANIHGANLDGITWEHLRALSTWQHLRARSGVLFAFSCFNVAIGHFVLDCLNHVLLDFLYTLAEYSTCMFLVKIKMAVAWQTHYAPLYFHIYHLCFLKLKLHLQGHMRIYIYISVNSIVDSELWVLKQYMHWRCNAEWTKHSNTIQHEVTTNSDMLHPSSIVSTCFASCCAANRGWLQTTQSAWPTWWSLWRHSWKKPRIETCGSKSSHLMVLHGKQARLPHGYASWTLCS